MVYFSLTVSASVAVRAYQASWAQEQRNCLIGSPCGIWDIAHSGFKSMAQMDSSPKEI